MTLRSKFIELSDEAATNRFGEDLALALRKGDLVNLCGDLGSGKSTLARALIRAACDEIELEVPSPTFTLVQTYDGNTATGPISHYDLYRIENAEEVVELAVDEAIENGIALIEWPDRARDYLPEFSLEISIVQSSENARTVTLCGGDALMLRVERSLAIRGFLSDNWNDATVRRYLLGDASSRTYETAEYDGVTRILMNAPRMSDGPVVKSGKPYSQIAHLAEDVRPFVAIAEILREYGFVAPKICASDLDAGLLLINHLGSKGVLDSDGKPEAKKYLAAINLLAKMHDCDWPNEVVLEDGHRHIIPHYDRDAMMIEVELMTKWYVPRISGTPVSEHALAEFELIWSKLIARLEFAEKSLVLRDYHSPNLLWVSDDDQSQQIGLIDFQDAVIGPSAYDVASLAQDARVTVSPELEQKLFGAYVKARQSTQINFDEDGFHEAYAIMAAQRATKVLGIFVRLDERDGKPGYLDHLPRIKSYLTRSLNHPILGDFKGWLTKNAGF